MNKKVLLVLPQNTLSMNIYPPLNLILIGSALENAGFDVEIVTCSRERNPLKTIAEKCQKALFVGITVLTPEVPHAIQIAKIIRENSDTPIVWGGWHATLFEDQMAESNLVDYVVIDEGDELIVYLANALAHRGSPYGKILKNQRKLDMNRLPMPNYGLIKNLNDYMQNKLTDKFLEYDNREVKWLPYQASRGCPFFCTFCINVVTDNRRYRKKNAEKVIAEVRQIIEKYGINHLKIIDDNFFVDIQWVKEIAGGFIREDFGITWDAECRVDYFKEGFVDDRLLSLLTRSGLNELNLGIESGSLRTLKIMKKEITPEQSLHAVKSCSDHGIVVRCSFIIDIPGEKEEDILKTVNLVNKIREIPKTTCGVQTYRPYPKSELCERLIAEGTIQQPRTLIEWSNKEYIEQYAHTDAKRKWQKNYHLSSKVSFYQSLESAMWLKPHQIRNSLIRWLNILFTHLARYRNRRFFYRFSFDIWLYKIFKNSFYYFREMRSR